MEGWCYKSCQTVGKRRQESGVTGRSGCSKVSEGALEAKPGGGRAAEGGYSQQGVTRQKDPGQWHRWQQRSRSQTHKSSLGLNWGQSGEE